MGRIARKKYISINPAAQKVAGFLFSNNKFAIKSCIFAQYHTTIPRRNMKKVILQFFAFFAALFARKTKSDTTIPKEVETPQKPQNKVLERQTANRKQFDENLTNWNASRPKPAPMREVYAANDGTIYYQYANLGDLPVIRSQMLQQANLKLLWAITPEYLERVFVPRYTEAAEAGDLAGVIAVVSDFLNRHKIAPEIPTMCEICAIMVIRHDENPYTFNPIIHAQKMRHAATDYDLQAFFLHTSWEVAKQVAAERLESWGIGSADGFLAYLSGEMPTR